MPSSRQASSSGQPGPIRLFATCTPGLGSLLRQELAQQANVRLGNHGHDGRNDLVTFTADESAVLELTSGLRLADDVFVQIGHTYHDPSDKPAWVAERLLHDRPLDRAFLLAQRLHHRGSGTTVRTVVRVLSEPQFTRTALRACVQRTILRLRPHWRVSDPAACEVWVCQYQKRAFVAGMRLTNGALRQHGGRAAERPGALRPPVAAAMVLLAGSPTGNLIDPCCGSGTILTEALDAGWTAIGCDIDRHAVAIAQANAPEAAVTVADCRNLDCASASAGAWVANVPFGRQFTMQQDPSQWLQATLSEAARVVRPGRRIVLLTPRLPRTAVPPCARLVGMYRIRLLGVPTTIWVLQRT